MTGASVTYDEVTIMSDEELIALALESNPKFTYGEVKNGLTMFMQMTRCVNLWRNEECYLAGDLPGGVLSGFPMERK